MSPMKPFVIDVYTDSSKGINRRRLEADSLQLALRMMDTHSQFDSTNRIVVSKRLGGTSKVSALKIWTRKMAS